MIDSHPRLVVIAASLLLAACGRDSAVPVGSDCGAASTSKPVLDESGRWGPPDTPLYRVNDDGGIELGNLSGGAWSVVSDHDFDGQARAMTSRDRRWIVLSGGHGGEHQFWLYDTATGRDRLVFRQSRMGETLPLLSPDGTTLAFYANMNRSFPDPARAGLYVVDTETGVAKHIGTPPGSRLDPRKSHGSVRWAADGTRLYVFRREFDADPDATEVNRYSPVEGRFESIAGQYNHDPYRPELRVDGTVVPLSDWLWMQSQLRWRDRVKSADGTLEARLDRATATLIVRGADGVARPIANGVKDDCGFSVVPRDWVGRYLVFRLHGGTYLHDFDRNRTRRLFPEGDEPLDFFWPTSAAKAR